MRATNPEYSGKYWNEMLSKRRYKFFISSVILKELEAFRNYKGFSVIFPKILDAIENV